ncbi:unnamed protein product [Microthlaspi erraticum]|uniref:F-box associated beta-propeller type 1 domain-containing protein n=1 Tax=Microthlaspi erraticum TaxID=1685480 RepID=A0A6D2HT27_9BRAS|nr:unnamed protein product [Microthlaspi erraticum]
MDTHLLVWNPLSEEKRWVKCDCHQFSEFDDAYSLGYVNNHCDYRILRFRCPTNFRRAKPARVEVYEFASNTWKSIDIVFDWILRSPLLLLSLHGTPYCIGLREQDTKAFLQSFDFSKEKFQPIDKLPFTYDQSNPLGLEILRDRVSVLEQCRETRKICVWVKHSLMTPSWSRLLVVDIPNFPLLHLPTSRFATNYHLDNNGRLLVTVAEYRSISICRVIGESQFQTMEAGTSRQSSCNYVPSLVKPPPFPKQDTSWIRWRRNK